MDWNALRLWNHQSGWGGTEVLFVFYYIMSESAFLIFFLYAIAARANNWLNLSHLSHCLRVQLAIIHRDTMKTSSTVPGQMVMRVLRTNLVLKLIRLRAPILRELASVNSLECRSITLSRRGRRNRGQVEWESLFGEVFPAATCYKHV